MSYTKQTWQAGDEITSAKLNHLEDGINNVATEIANFPVEVNNPQDGDTLIYNAAEQKWVNGSGGGSGGGILKVGIDMETEALDKTWKEINDALSAGYYVTIITDPEDVDASGVNLDVIFKATHGNKIGYVISAYSYGYNNITEFRASEENGYPHILE